MCAVLQAMPEPIAHQFRSDFILVPSHRRHSPHHKNVPVAVLVDILEAMGWKAKNELLFHTKHSGKFYDGRGIHKKRAYLQCLLAKKEITRLQPRFRPMGGTFVQHLVGSSRVSFKRSLS